MTLAEVDDGPSRPAIVRGDGVTDSLSAISPNWPKSLYLNLWCYPNAFIDKKPGGSGDGKELCDLLVVCGDHILIFSDKTVAWPAGDDTDLAWRRSFKRAIHKSADQIRGAERWIAQFPNRIFIDRKCTTRLPLKLPPAEQRKVHADHRGERCGEGLPRSYGRWQRQPDGCSIHPRGSPLPRG